MASISRLKKNKMAQETNIKPGDIVRLTDPISNGEVVRIESVNEYGFASWLGGSQNCDMEQISILEDLDSYSPIGNDIDGYFFLVSEIVEEIEKRVNAQTWLNLKRPFKLYPESAVEYWKQRAEVEKKEHTYYEQAWEKEHSKLLNAQDELCLCKRDILTLVNLIPCNDGNGSIINDIKNLLK